MQLLHVSGMLGVVVASVAGCPREQTTTLPPSTDLHVAEISDRYRALGDRVVDRLEAARAELDQYCDRANASHHTNLTFISCGYDVHHSIWKGQVLVEATCTVQGFKATYAREVAFEHVRQTWNAGQPGSSSASLPGDPPAEVRRVLKGFSDTLSKHFPKPGRDEEPWE